MLDCDMEQQVDCTASWTLRHTSYGSCLTLNTNEAYGRERILSDLKLSFKNGVRRKFKSVPNGTGLEVSSKMKSLSKIFQRETMAKSTRNFPEPDQIKNLNFVIGFNKSDNTFGWNGLNNGLHLFYSDFDEEYISRENSIALVPSLHPSLTFTQMSRKFLGKPFTSCNPGVNYTQRTCQVHEYMAEVLDKCGCYPG